ncbi:MAG: DUF5611 family protein [Candidatus Thermoplasmatota archaeon]|nr:DUF5611 family protein [Candidatus Thermoplasmatota archaeon]
MAREYPVKKGFKTDPESILQAAVSEGVKGKIEKDHVLLSLPGISLIDIFMDGKHLMVETKNDASFSDPMTAIRGFNTLIEKITGYNSKERKKKFSKL